MRFGAFGWTWSIHLRLYRPSLILRYGPDHWCAVRILQLVDDEWVSWGNG